MGSFAREVIIVYEFHSKTAKTIFEFNRKKS